MSTGGAPPRLGGPGAKLGPGDGVEGAGAHAFTHAEGAQAHGELAGRAAREREGEHVVGVLGAGGAPPHDAPGEHARLAGAGAGEHAEGLVVDGDRQPLLRVEAGQQGVRLDGIHRRPP